MAIAARSIRALVLCLALAPPAAAQSPPAGSAPWGRRELDAGLTAGALVGATAGSFLIEEDVRRLLRRQRSGVADALERLGWWYGTPLFTAPASLLTLGGGALSGDDDVRDVGLLMSGVLVSALLVQQPVRIVVGRARPSTGEGHTSFRPLTIDNRYASFVSGHTWSAVGISTVVARQVDRWWAYAGLYSLAAVTALSRLYADRHWLTDVVLGAVAGYAVGTALWEEQQRNGNGEITAAAGTAPATPWLMVRLRI